jgi:protease-4
MQGFFKTFFASLLALITFSLLVLLIAVVFVGDLTSKVKPNVRSKAVLVVDLSQHYQEQVEENALSILRPDGERQIPGMYDVVRLLQKAKTDKDIQGVYILANPSPNGFAASSELREALVEFKSSGKFILAHADVITQKSYFVANVADKIYMSPQGFFEWFGYSVNLAFIKGTLEKLDIQPQIFYAGKFKSATEPLRAENFTL